jgi:hypothetical protein
MKIIKNKYFLIGFILPFLVAGGMLYAVWSYNNYTEKRDRQMFLDGYEQGNYEGLTDGYNAAYDEFYEKLSPNPQVAYLFKKYFPNQEEARIMRAISLAESKGKQGAVNSANRNGTVDAGFFQLNTVHKRKGETTQQFITRMHNLEENFKEARNVLNKQGLTAWSTYNNKAYLSYIK